MQTLLRRNRVLPACAALALLVPACAVRPDTVAPTTPQRPTLSSNTSTTAPGTVEVEVGALFDPDDKIDTPLTAKWGFDEGNELYVGWSPFLWISAPGDDPDGPGDVLIGSRHRVFEETAEAPSAALQLQAKLPAADRTEGLGSGEIDFFAAGILTKSIDPVTVTGFYQFGVIGDPAGGVDPQHALALAGDVAVADRVSLFGELASIIDEDRASLFTIVGTAVSLRRGLTFDVGCSLGLDDDAPAFELLVGLTQNLGNPGLARTSARRGAGL